MKKSILISLCSIMAVLALFGCGCNGNKPVDDSEGPITEDEAKEIATEYVDLFDVEDISSCTLNKQDPNAIKYDIKFNLDYVQFMVSVAEKDGTVLQFESETTNAGNQNADGSAPKDLGITAIKKIATEQVSGSSESDVYRCLYTGLSEDEPIYDVALFYNGKIYTFQINPSTGEILNQESKEIAE